MYQLSCIATKQYQIYVWENMLLYIEAYNMLYNKVAEQCHDAIMRKQVFNK